MEPRSIQPAVAELERAYSHFNKELFNNELNVPVVVTIQTSGMHKALGWTRYLGWDLSSSTTQLDEIEGLGVSSDKSVAVADTYIEINIVAEALLRDPYGTLLHEMVHAWNYIQGSRDCSANGYHTKVFKDAAERVGLTVEKHPHMGYAQTAWGDKGREAMISLHANWDAFSLVRKDITKLFPASDAVGGSPAGTKITILTGADGPGSRAKGGGPKKWRCPQCKVTVYSGRKELNVICGDCHVNLERV